MPYDCGIAFVHESQHLHAAMAQNAAYLIQGQLRESYHYTPDFSRRARGTCWCGGTVWQGRTAMQISVSSWATAEDDVARSLAAIERAAASTALPPATSRI